MKAPAFQFYTQDFLVGIMGMTDAEVGMYIKMLAIQWERGPLPGDPGTLQRVINSRVKTPQVVLSKFTRLSDGTLRNERLEAERSKQQAYRESRSKNASKRWIGVEGISDAHAEDVQDTSNACAPAQSSSSDFSHIPIVPDLSRPEVEYEEVVKLYNATCSRLPAVKMLTPARRKAIKTRWHDAGHSPYDAFRHVFEMVAGSDFLAGGNDKKWAANFDWILHSSNWAKIIEGNYANKSSRSIDKRQSTVDRRLHGIDTEELMKWLFRENPTANPLLQPTDEPVLAKIPEFKKWKESQS